MNEDAFEHLPKDLQDIGDALREHRDLADGHQLERVRRRALPGQDRSVRTLVPRRARSRAALILVVGLVLNVSGAMASVLKSVGVSTTSANNLKVTQIVASVASSVSTGNTSQSAADHVYCDTEGTTYTKFGVMNGGSHDKDCCPDDSHSSVNTYNHTGGSQGGDDECCPSDSSSSMNTSMHSGGGGSDECCPSESSSTVTTSMHSGGSHDGSDECCPQKTGYVTINGQMQGGGSGQCCPSSSSSSTYNHTGGGSDGCCPSSSSSQVWSTTGTNNGGSHGCQPPPEKPGCGDEKNIGISGNSGAHGGQPPKKEERGDCPHDPGQDGN